MNRMSLSDASFETLLRLADNYGVEVPEDAARAEVEEMVADAIDEWKAEHRKANSHSVRIEETKYDVQATERPASHMLGEDVELPETYDENRIVLLLRDPAWAFAYWDIGSADVVEMEKSESFAGLILRVSHFDSDESEPGPNGTFDIPVTLLDSRWYIHLPEQPAFYRIELVAEFESKSRTLARSNVVGVPLGMIAEDFGSGSRGDEATDARDAILAQTGIQDLDVASEGRRIPQRILDLIDEDLLFN